MGAGDMCLTVIGLVTDRPKWCGCNTELCSVEQSGLGHLELRGGEKTFYVLLPSSRG